MIQTHPTKIIETEQGNIVVEAPDTARSTALFNSIYTYILTDEDLAELNRMADDAKRNEYIQNKSLRKGMTMYQLTILSYITSAPFHLNDYYKNPILDLESFLRFADIPTISKIGDAVKALGMIDPLSL